MATVNNGWRNGVNKELGALMGKVEALMRTQEEIRDDIRQIREEMTGIQSSVGLLKGKLAVWGALGGALVSLLVQAIMIFAKGGR